MELSELNSVLGETEGDPDARARLGAELDAYLYKPKRDAIDNAERRLS